MEVLRNDCLRYLSIKEYQRKSPSSSPISSPNYSLSESPVHYNVDEVMFTMNKDLKVDVNRIYSHLLKRKKRNSFSY